MQIYYNLKSPECFQAAIIHITVLKWDNRKDLRTKYTKKYTQSCSALAVRLIFHSIKNISTGKGSSKLTCNILLKELQINAINPFH